METIFCGGTSICPFNFKTDEISFCSILPTEISAFFCCSSVSLMILLSIAAGFSSVAGFLSPQADKNKVSNNKFIIGFMLLAVVIVYLDNCFIKVAHGFQVFIFD